MDLDRLDPEGFIRPEPDLANLQPEYQGVPIAAADLLADEFGSQLHSAYLYGSVARGTAVPGRSDVDLLAVLPAAPAAQDRARAERVERALTERFPVLFSAGWASPTSRRSAPRPSATACRSSSESWRCAAAVRICGRACHGPSRRRRSQPGSMTIPMPPSPVRARPWAPRPIPRSSGACAG